jgi:hypothetical protein
MSELSEKLSELLRRPVKRPDDAERVGEAAEALAELLHAEERAERILTSRQPPMAARQSLAGRVLQDAAEAVLEEAGQPLHAAELGRRMKARGWSHPRGASSPNQIVHQLAARLPRYPRRFRRVAPNTFSLTRWGALEAAPAPKPRVGLFSSPGGSTGRQIGESPDLPPGEAEWRSS